MDRLRRAAAGRFLILKIGIFANLSDKKLKKVGVRDENKNKYIY
jgi:hypothetical protein